RLADAGLAGDRDDGADAVGQPLQLVAHGGQLGIAADQRLVRAVAARLALADYAEAVDRLLAPAQLGGAQLLQLEAAPHLGRGLGAERDVGLLGQRLQAGGDVDGVAERVVAAALVAVAGRHYHRAGVDGDARAQIDVVGLAYLVAVAGQRALDR